VGFDSGEIYWRDIGEEGGEKLPFFYVGLDFRVVGGG